MIYEITCTRSAAAEADLAILSTWFDFKAPKPRRIFLEFEAFGIVQQMSSLLYSMNRHHSLVSDQFFGH